MFIYSLLVIILFMLLLAFFFHCVYLQPTCYFSLNAHANVFLPLVYLQPSWCYNISYIFLLMFFCHCVYLLYSLLVIFLWLPTLMFFCCYVYLQPTCYFSLIVFLSEFLIRSYLGKNKRFAQIIDEKISSSVFCGFQCIEFKLFLSFSAGRMPLCSHRATANCATF